MLQPTFVIGRTHFNTWGKVSYWPIHPMTYTVNWGRGQDTQVWILIKPRLLFSRAGYATNIFLNTQHGLKHSKSRNLLRHFSFLYSNHIDWKIDTIYFKSVVHHQSCLNCVFIFKFFKNSMIIFEYYTMLNEWLRNAP